MAKNSIRDYSATNSSNTDIQSIDISEGCSPAGINNAIREVMADLKDVSTGAVALESPAFDSASLTGDLTFGDNDKAVFGAGSDLQIYHNGSDSYIIDDGTGNLNLRASSQIKIQSLLGEDCAIFNENGSSSLQYDNATKFATTATGVDVTGYIDYGPSSGNIGKIGFDSNNVYIGSTSSTGSIHFRNNIGSTDAPHSSGDDKMVITDSGVGIGTSVTGDAELVVYGADAATIYKNTNTGTGTSDGFFVGLAKGNGTDAYVYQRENTNMIFGTNNTERLRIDSSGNVGIGTSSPVSKLDLASGNITISNSTNAPYINFVDNTTRSQSLSRITMDQVSGTAGQLLFSTTTGGTLAERMRIDSSGSLLVGTTSADPVSTNVKGIALEGAHGSAKFSRENVACLDINRKTSDGEVARIYKNGSQVGNISVTGSSTSYNTSSDYRLKENLVADWDATTRLKQLNPVRFNFIADPDTTVDGFLAHEVQSVVPEAISGTHNGMRDEEYQVSAATGDIYTPAIEAVLDEDGNEVTPAVAEVIHSTDVERPEELVEGQQWRETTAAVMGTRSVPDYQGIDQSKLVPLLVKTIQELEARITALEAN